MKKLCLAAFFIITSISFSNAQEVRFGITGGYVYGEGKASLGGTLGSLLDIFEFDADIEALDGSGLYIGLLADIGVGEKFSVQPELLYAGIDGESVLVLPIMAKYYIVDKLHLLGGPQLDFLIGLDDLEKEALKTTGISLGFGAGYDITDAFTVHARYTAGLNNRVDSDWADTLGVDVSGFSLTDPEIKVNTFQLGLVYKFQ